MAKLTEEAKQKLTYRPSLVATASKSGKPNVSPKGSVRVLDDEHVVFADVDSPRTMANLKENPQVAIICIDMATRNGCRVWGKAEIINSGPIFDKVVAELAGIGRGRKINNIVNIAVEEVITF